MPLLPIQRMYRNGTDRNIHVQAKAARMLQQLYFPKQDHITMPNTEPNADDALLSRGLQSNLFGGLDDSLDFRINGDFKLEAMQFARKRGYTSTGDFVRMAMAKEMYGAAHVVSMVTKQILGDAANVGQAQDVQS